MQEYLVITEPIGSWGTTFTGKSGHIELRYGLDEAKERAERVSADFIVPKGSDLAVWVNPTYRVSGSGVVSCRDPFTVRHTHPAYRNIVTDVTGDITHTYCVK